MTSHTAMQKPFGLQTRLRKGSPGKRSRSFQNDPSYRLQENKQKNRIKKQYEFIFSNSLASGRRNC